MNKIMFYRLSDKYGIFSNFSEHPFNLDGTRWKTVEHYFQARKFLDGRLALKIQMSQNPMEAAKIGRDKSNPLRPDWESVKDDIMRKAVEAKFRQNKEPRQLLLSTADSLIVEHTSNDSYWGDGPDGHGKNMLGKILMETRDKLLSHKNAKPSYLPPPWEVNPDMPLHSINWAMGPLQGYLDDWSEWFLELTLEEQKIYVAKKKVPKDWNKMLNRLIGSKPMGSE